MSKQDEFEKARDEYIDSQFPSFRGSKTHMRNTADWAYSYAQKEIDELRAEVIENLTDILCNVGYYDKENDWFETMARSTVCDAGERLIELGVAERAREGHGRMQYYRLKSEEKK